MSKVIKNVVTPKQVAALWAKLPHRLHLNLWNFEVKAAQAAVKTFQKSFDLKRFNSKGEIKWKPRSPKSKGGHPLMTETGSLRNSIIWKHLGTGKGEHQGVTIFTNPAAFANTKSHQGFCFAAVHNAANYEHTRTGSVKNMPRRQFIGHSTVLKEELDKLTNMIFQGFPT